jgi:hypothetical protein
MKSRFTAVLAAVAAIAASVLLLPADASALTFAWIGGATGNWNDAAEWDTVDAGGSEAAWPSTSGDIAIFPVGFAGAITVTIPTGVAMLMTPPVIVNPEAVRSPVAPNVTTPSSTSCEKTAPRRW